MINRLQALDWEIVFVTADDLYRHPHDVVRTVRAALSKPAPSRIQRAQRGNSGVDNPAEPADCARSRRA